ncbi:methionine adenosyltransferase [Sinorhizobium fredii]|uniref:methionine adenosyltransferase n=1 Tax=Sinorhizobium TaxID=28105 RepID=UPI001FCBD5E6|nr:methionine adenosyltransferase [Sinorhizobium fredii]
MCDTLAETLSRNLCRLYQQRFGRILHHNVEVCFRPSDRRTQQSCPYLQRRSEPLGKDRPSGIFAIPRTRGRSVRSCFIASDCRSQRHFPNVTIRDRTRRSQVELNDCLPNVRRLEWLRTAGPNLDAGGSFGAMAAECGQLLNAVPAQSFRSKL